MSNFIFCNPLEDTYRITSKYGYRTHPIRGGKVFHGGIDQVDDKRRKVDVHVIADGTVRIVENKTTGYGKHVIVTHFINGKKYETNYAHLDSISVKVGQKLRQGEKLGVLGTSGTSTGLHLHLGVNSPIYRYDGGKYPNSIDPMKLIDFNFKPSQARNGKSQPKSTTPTLPNITVKDDEVMLNQTARDEIRNLIKKAVKEKVIDAKFHTDAKINKYSDGELVSYAIIYFARKTK